ncbi:acyltransferase [Agromyces tardus]|uniref:Acyltransferase n=1 Tax=Agromyces tardus TaxID=2583849 RepID=A0A3M8ACF1_9MICO|nr:acyltransferase family protein [Agromyces tardus]RNB48227.1 acyltransferase [Agromyces tardus]
MQPTDLRSPTPTPVATRSAGIDGLRLMGVVAVVFGHVWATGLTHPALFIWHVPVFFVLSGYLWRPGRSLLGEVRKRARSLLVPYVLWLAVVTLGWALFTDIVGTRQWPDPMNLLLGGARLGGQYAAFWFVTALFVAAVAMRAFSALWEWLPLVVGVAVLALAYVQPEWVRWVPWSAGVALAALVFMAIGDGLRRVRGQISAPVPIGLALAGVGLALSISGVVPPVDMKAAGFGAPIATVLVSAAISCGMILFFEGVQHRIPERAGRIVTLLAGVALPVILGHALFIAIGRAVGAPSIAIFTAALLVPMLAGLVLARFRVGRLFV